MPEKDLVPHNVEQDTVQIYLSEERDLIPSFKWSHLGGSTHVSLSLSLCFSSFAHSYDRTPLGSNRDVSLSKPRLLPKSTGNTQEAVAPSQHD